MEGPSRAPVGLAVVLEVLAILVAIAACGRLARADRTLRAQTAAITARRDALVGQTMWLESRDLRGRRLVPQIPARTTHLVIFVLRRSTARPDAAYWRQVEASMRNAGGIWLLGYCNGAECNRAMLESGQPGFSLAGYGEVLGMQIAHLADEDGKLLVVGKRGIIEAIFPWRQSTPQQTADFLVRLK